MPQKLSGIYECETASEHPLLDGFPPNAGQWRIRGTMRSRRSLSKARAIRSSAHAPRVGADSFVKEVGGSLFLFLQGHLEYAPDSLFREYRRDIRRFLTGESATYPEMPENYFDRKTARQLTKLRIKAERSHSPRLLAEIYAVFAAAQMRALQTPAAQLYANWLSYLAQEKARRNAATRRRARSAARRRMSETVLFPSAEQRRDWGEALTALLAEAELRVADGPVTPRFDRDQFARELAAFDFARPMPFDDLMAWTVAQLEHGVTHMTHPRYLGLFNPAPSFPAQCADRIAASFNPQLASQTTSPVAVAIEAHVIRAVAHRAGFAAAIRSGISPPAARKPTARR